MIRIKIMKQILYKSILLFGLMAGLFTGCSDDDESLGTATIAVDNFTPAEGLSGTEITITGGPFTENSRVFFNETEVENYVSRTGNTLVVQVPENASTGRIGVVDGNEFGFSTTDFSYIPGAVIESLSTEQAPVGETITITGRNFFDIGVENIRVYFGSASATVISATTTTLVVIVPEGAESGPIRVQFGDIQTVTGPNFTVGKLLFSYYFTHLDVEDMQGACNPCSYTDVQGGGTCFYDKGVYADGFNDQSPVGSFTLWDNVSGDYCTFRVNVLEEDDYYIYFGTKGKATGNLTISAGSDLTNLSQSLTRECSADSYNWPANEYEYGIFHLQPGTNYIRFDFGASIALTDIHITNERLTGDHIIIGEDVIQGLYACDFNEGMSYAPFTDAWAYDPCYIKTVDQCLEFYYNAAALQANNIRQRRGCEVTCEFHTTTEGWYGFRVYLPEGKFPMDEGGIIIAQIFNGGCRNSWAGHLSIENGMLKFSHRHALIDPVVGEVAQLETNRWYPIVVHFKAGLNNKGRLRAWIGDDMVESAPAYDSGNCNFGFGHWIDDETLDDTGTNAECLAYSSYGGKDALGCKFGLYVQNQVDITIRFDDIKALEGNPAGAFDIVKP